MVQWLGSMSLLRISWWRESVEEEAAHFMPNRKQRGAYIMENMEQRVKIKLGTSYS